MDAPQEPRWLDPEERQAWVTLASALVRLPAALDVRHQRRWRVNEARRSNDLTR